MDSAAIIGSAAHLSARPGRALDFPSRHCCHKWSRGSIANLYQTRPAELFSWKAREHHYLPSLIILLTTVPFKCCVETIYVSFLDITFFVFFLDVYTVNDEKYYNQSKHSKWGFDVDTHDPSLLTPTLPLKKASRNQKTNEEGRG